MENDSKPTEHSNQASGEKSSNASPLSNEHHAIDTSTNQDRANREQKHPLEWAIAFLLLFTLLATSAAAYYTRQQWRTAEDQERRSLRAYIGFDTTVKLHFTETDLAISVENFGQTPAKEVHIWGSWEFVPFGEDLPSGFKFIVKPPCGGLPPKQTMLPGAMTVYPRNPVDTHQYFCSFDLLDVKRAEKNETNAFLYGYIEYLDVFDRHHVTNFCFLYYPAISTALFCNRHNEIDAEE